MNASVGSRGSPLPKSISSIPRARSRRFASSSRTKGYVPVAARTGERRMRLDRSEEPGQRLVGAGELGDLDLLVARVGVASRARAEVDGVDPAARELGHRRPRLLGLEL